MEFKKFNELMQRHVASMVEGKNHLFEVDVDHDTVWGTYLDSFPEGTNEIFRERREFDCDCCRRFIRDFGRVVSITDQKVTTIWDFDAKSEKFQTVVDALSALIKSRAVGNVFLSDRRSIGTSSTIDLRDLMSDGSRIRWHHFHVNLPGSIKTYMGVEAGSKRGIFRDVRNVFQRSLEEIDLEAVGTVMDLISQKSLYKGEEWEKVLGDFGALHVKYHKISSRAQKDLFCWETSVKVGPVIGKIRNHSIGTLLTDISEGVELDEAVRKYEAMVAPSNYQRSRPVFTKKMIEAAQVTVKELGYENSLGRRHAQIDDITVNNVLFANRDSRRVMTKDVFEELADSVPSKPRNLSKVEEISIEKFVSDVLPTASDVEVYLENSHAQNMCSLIAPLDASAKSILKWGNNFSWTYSGNITDSTKQRVKAAGGKVDGELRFSIQWNEDDSSLDDLDAHCIEPCGNRIYFERRDNRSTTGNLDVDITSPSGVAVENITWSQRRIMGKGKYEFLVHCYASRHAQSGFTAEIEFDGQVYSFEHAAPLRQSEFVNVADVTFDGTGFKLKERMKSTESSRDIWGLASNKFHPVSIAMHSPNYWDDQKGIGHRHYFFMINGCKNPESCNGFFNEFLDTRLRDHRKVFEVLGAKFRVEDSDEQLSGLGFSATKRAHVIVKVTGSFDRLLKVKF